MKNSRKKFAVLALMLIFVLMLQACGSCRGNENITEGSTSSNVSDSTESDTTDNGLSESGSTESDTTDNGLSESDSSESDTTDNDLSESGSTENNSTESNSAENVMPETEPPALLNGDNAEMIELADRLKNNVTAYFSDSSRKGIIYENMEMTLEYMLSTELSPKVASITNKIGNAYIQNTMDVFVKMSNGQTYYASKTQNSVTPNIYRMGYYFYEMRNDNHMFWNDDVKNLSEMSLDVTKTVKGINGVTVKTTPEGIIRAKNPSSPRDPQMLLTTKLDVNTKEYPYLQITMKADSNCESLMEIFFQSTVTDFSGDNQVNCSLITDGEYHTYLVPMFKYSAYTGTLKGLRFDINGSNAFYEISDIRMVSVDNPAYALMLSRYFNVYSNKMHQGIQISALNETSGISEIGFLTEIKADTVAKLIVKDSSNDLHTSLEGVDWNTVEYVGFDIKNAGIFGYILPFDGKGGKLHIELVGDKYVITQTMTPENGTIIPSITEFDVNLGYAGWVEGGNTNDFYMGSRVYTDDNHSFDEFLYEAFCERNPLDERKIHVSDSYSTVASYVGYDSLRGIYRFNIEGPVGGFNIPYYGSPNKHYRANFMVRGDEYDREIYVMTYTSAGTLECAVLLDGKDVMLPVSLEVGKNFNEGANGERSLYNLDDDPYGEVIFPLVVNKGVKYEYTVLNLYQNWGKFPLKQISWIQFYNPYLHLSTGVTESNCIIPLYYTDRSGHHTLPDNRAASAPLWEDQPQHVNSGFHTWLYYIDSKGNEIYTENTKLAIDSHGPTYADIEMEYISDDGKIKVTYVHSEMPQTDENRAFYEMKYEILEDVTISNPITDLSLYSMGGADAVGYFTRVGYLNEKNECSVVNAHVEGDAKTYVLGDNCPYFTLFDMVNCVFPRGYCNMSFLIYNSSFDVAAFESDPGFAIVNANDTIKLTLNIDSPVTFKAGDTFNINAIVLPWGGDHYADGIIDPDSGNYEYTMVLDGATGEQYMDKNVRDVRENTLINPLKATANANCEVLESVFIPKLKSTNGESAEFTLSGGYNNIAVRVYGFNKNTVPTIYEKIGGEWVKYDVSSQSVKKDPHFYDGYCIYYDGDGTFSYSFVVSMDGKTDRTFKIVADGNHKKWNKEELSNLGGEDLLEFYIDPFEFSNAEGQMLAYEFASGCEVLVDDVTHETFIRIFGAGLDAKQNEGYATLFGSTNPIGGCGKYLVFKYRLPDTNKQNPTSFQIFLSTKTMDATQECCVATNLVTADGEWNVVIIDLEQVENDVFRSHLQKSDDGLYYLQLLRFDFFNTKMSEESHIDICFVGLDSSIEKIFETSGTVSSIKLIEGNAKLTVDTATGEVVNRPPAVPEVLVSPESQYKESNAKFGAILDSVNDINASNQSGSSKGVGIFGMFDTTMAENGAGVGATGSLLKIGGWCVVEGGIDRYVWSADGGKTWNNCTSYYNHPPVDASEAMIAAASPFAANHTFSIETDKANGSFQSGMSLCVDLSEYAGQTVDVILAVIPAKDTSSVLPIFYIRQATVLEKAEAVIPDITVDPDFDYGISEKKYGANLDYVNGVKSDMASGSNSALPEFDYNGSTVAGSGTGTDAGKKTYVWFQGWCVTESGVGAYVWSADGGNTWYECSPYLGNKAIGAIPLMINVASNLSGKTLTSADGINASFQSQYAISADLSAYAGSTVDVILGVIPISDTTSVLPIYVINGVTVAN